MYKAIEMATEHNPNIQQAQIGVQIANQRLREARGSRLPEVFLNTQYIRNFQRPVFFLPDMGEGPFAGGGVIEAGFDNSYMATLQGSIPVFNQQVFVSTDIAQLSANLSETDVAIQQNEITSDVRATFFNALLAWESIQALEEGLRNAESNLANIRDLYSQGLVPEYDVIRAEVSVENLKPGISRARNAFVATMNQLKLLAGIPVDQPVRLVGRLMDYYRQVENPNIMQYMLNRHPNIVQMDQQAELVERQIDLEKAAYYPSLSLFGNYQLQAQANDFNFGDYRWVNTSAAGFSLNIPIFSGFIRRHRVNQAELELRGINIQRDHFYKSLQVQAQNLIHQIDQARMNIDAQEANIRQAERGYLIAQVSYERGAATFLDVNDAELALTQARMNLIEAINDYLIALSDFDRVTLSNVFDER
jgi:outer membrane protein